MTHKGYILMSGVAVGGMIVNREASMDSPGRFGERWCSKKWPCEVVGRECFILQNSRFQLAVLYMKKAVVAIPYCWCHE